MSFISCEGSALIPAVLPPTNSISAVGSVIVPTLLATPTASGGGYTYFNAITLPKGVWMISGNVRLDAITGGATVDSGVIQFLYDGVNVDRYGLNLVGGAEWLVASGVVVSDGTKQLTCIGTATTSAGNYQLEIGANSTIYLVRVA